MPVTSSKTTYRHNYSYNISTSCNFRELKYIFCHESQEKALIEKSKLFIDKIDTENCLRVKLILDK
jgi:hypothetical protein